MTARLLAPLVVGLVFTGCAGSPVTSVTAASGLEGVAYSLPRTIVELRVVIAEVAGDAIDRPPSWTIALTGIPHQVADPTHRFVLQRNGAWWHDDQVNVTLTESGLLASVSSKTEDQSLKSVGKVIEAAIGVVKLQALGGIGQMDLQASVPLNPNDIARQHIDAELARQLRPLVGTHQRFWALPSSGPIEATFAEFPGPGWTLRVALASVEKAAAQAGLQVSEATSETMPVTPSAGVFVRGFSPFVLSAELSGTVSVSAKPDLAALREELTESAGKEVRDKEAESATQDAIIQPYGNNATAELKAAVARAKAALANAQKEQADLPRYLQGVENRIAAAISAEAQRQGLAPGAHGFEQQRSATARAQVLVADYCPITRLPLERAVFVRSDESVALSNGAVTAHSWNRPSSGAAIAAFPLTVVQQLIALPSELIQLKFNIASSEEALAAKLAELEKKLAAPDAERLADESAYFGALALAINAKAALDELGSEAKPQERQAARLAFVNAAISANAAARKLGRSIPFPEVEQR